MSADLEPTAVAPEFIKEGADWLAVFNPAVPRQMDVQLVHKLKHDNPICSVKLSPGGHTIAAGSDGAIVFYDLNTRKQTILHIGLNGRKRNYIRAVAFNPDGSWLASGSEDAIVRVWCVATQQLIRTFTGHRTCVYAIAFAPSPHALLVSASGDRTIRLWPTAQQHIHAHPKFLYPVDDPTKSGAAFTSVCVSPDGAHVAAGSLDGAVRVWDLSGLDPEDEDEDGGVMCERLRGHADSVYSVGFGGGPGLSIVSAGLDKMLKRWDVRFDGGPAGSEGGGERGSRCVKTMGGHKDCVLGTALGREGQAWCAASASRDGTVRLWDLKSGVAYFSIQGHKDTVTCVDLNTESKTIISGSGDKEVRIWRYNIL